MAESNFQLDRLPNFRPLDQEEIEPRDINLDEIFPLGDPGEPDEPDQATQTITPRQISQQLGGDSAFEQGLSGSLGADPDEPLTAEDLATRLNQSDTNLLQQAGVEEISTAQARQLINQINQRDGGQPTPEVETTETTEPAEPIEEEPPQTPGEPTEEPEEQPSQLDDIFPLGETEEEPQEDVDYDQVLEDTLESGRRLSESDETDTPIVSTDPSTAFLDPDFLDTLEAGAGRAAEDVYAGAARYAGFEDLGDWLEETGKQWRENVAPPPQTQIDSVWSAFNEGDLGEWLETTVAGQAPNSALIMGSALVAGTGASIAGPALGLGTLGTTALVGMSQAGTIGLEAFVEAGSTYNEVRDRGGSKEEANEAADQVFTENVAALSGTNTLQAMLAFAPTPGSTPLRLATKLAGVGAMENLEERLQEGVIQPRALGEEGSLVSEKAERAGRIGTVFGLMFGGGGEVANLVSEIPAKVKERLDEEQREQLEQMEQDPPDPPPSLSGTGLDMENFGELQALDRLAQQDEQVRQTLIQVSEETGNEITQSVRSQLEELQEEAGPVPREDIQVSNVREIQNKENPEEFVRRRMQQIVFMDASPETRVEQNDVDQFKEAIEQATDLDADQIESEARAAVGVAPALPDNTITQPPAVRRDQELARIEERARDLAVPTQSMEQRLRDQRQIEQDILQEQPETPTIGDLTEFQQVAEEQGVELEEQPEQVAEEQQAGEFQEPPADAVVETEEGTRLRTFSEMSVDELVELSDEAFEIAESQIMRTGFETARAEDVRAAERLEEALRRRGRNEDADVVESRLREAPQQEEAQTETAESELTETDATEAESETGEFQPAEATETERQQIPDEETLEQQVVEYRQNRGEPFEVPQQNRGESNRVATPDDIEVDTEFAVVEMDEVATSFEQAYPDAIQNRLERQGTEIGPRTRQSIDNKKNANLDPLRLGKTRAAGTGAPIVSNEGIVESGNLRTRVLQETRQESPQDFNRYREFLMNNADRFGIPEQSIQEMDAPILVRRRKTDLSGQQRLEFIESANTAETDETTAAERAVQDARRANLENLPPIENAELFTQGNREFLGQLIEQVVPASEQAPLRDEDGQFTQAGRDRIRNALFAAAWPDVELIQRFSERTDLEGVRNLIDPMATAAPDIAQMKSQMEQGNLWSELDFTDAWMTAFENFVSIKSSDEFINFAFNPDVNETKLAQYIDSPRLVRLGMSPIEKDFVVIMDRFATGFSQENEGGSKQKVRMFLDELVTQATGAGDPNQGNLISGVEDGPTRSMAEVVARAKRAVEVEYGQSPMRMRSLFRQLEPRIQDWINAHEASEDGLQEILTTIEQARSEMTNGIKMGMDQNQLSKQIEEEYGVSIDMISVLKTKEEQHGYPLLYYGLVHEGVEVSGDARQVSDETKAAVNDWFQDQHISEEGETLNPSELPEDWREDIERWVNQRELSPQNMDDALEIAPYLQKWGNEWSLQALKDALIIFRGIGGGSQRYDQKMKEHINFPKTEDPSPAEEPPISFPKIGQRPPDPVQAAEGLEPQSNPLDFNGILQSPELQEKGLAEDLHEKLQRYADAHQDIWESYRRLGHSRDDSRRDASGLDQSKSDFLDMTKGSTLNVDEFRLGRSFLIDHAVKYYEKRQELQEKGDEVTEEDVREISQLEKEITGLFNTLSGATSEAARLMREVQEVETQELAKIVQRKAHERLTSLEDMQEADKKAGEVASLFQINQSLQTFGIDPGQEQIQEELLNVDLTDKVEVEAFIEKHYKHERSHWETLTDGLNWLWYNSVLSGLKTFERNVAGMTYIAERPVLRPIEALFEPFWNSQTGQARTANFLGEGGLLTELGAMLEGAKKGISNAGTAWLHGTRSEHTQATDYFRPGRDPFPAGMPDKYVAALSWPTRNILALDEIARSMIVEAEYQNLKYRELIRNGELQSIKDLGTLEAELGGVSGLNEDALEQARQDAARHVYQGKPGETFQVFKVFRWLNNLNRRLQDTQGPMGPIASFASWFIPFQRTAGLLFEVGARHTPFGYIPAVRNMNQAAKEISAGNPDVAAHIKQTGLRQFAEATLGTFILTGLATWVMSGHITGAGPEDDDLLGKMYDNGYIPFSFRVGDTNFSYRYLMPHAFPLAIMSSAVEQGMYSTGESWTSLFGGTLSDTAEFVQKQSFMYTIGRMTKYMLTDDAEDMRGNPFLDPISGLIPYSSMLRSIRGATDPAIREPRTYWEEIKNQIPGLSEDVPPLRDRFNNVIEYDNPLGAMNNFIIPRMARVKGELQNIREQAEVNQRIRTVQGNLRDRLEPSVDLPLSMENWLIGEYIVSSARSDFVGPEETIEIRNFINEKEYNQRPGVKGWVNTIIAFEEDGYAGEDITKTDRELLWYDGQFLAEKLVDRLTASQRGEWRSQKFQQLQKFLRNTKWAELPREERDRRIRELTKNVGRVLRNRDLTPQQFFQGGE